MKLQFAENLRRLRHGHGLTQEQLAEKLGVSFQTVSRWETGAVYPDIELLPVMSELFDVTVDELIGCDRYGRKERLRKSMELVHATESPEEQYSLLKEMRMEFKGEWEISQELLLLIYSENFHKDDLREIVLDVLQNCTDGDIRRDAVFIYVSLGEEKYITKDFLSKHAGGEIDKALLMRNRYLYSEEWDKYEIYRKNCLLLQLDDMFFSGLRTKKNLSAEKSVQAQQIGLGIINSLCNVIPTHPVSGDGVADLWSSYRILMGFRLSCALASTGNIEASFEALEDTVSMIEKLISLPDGTKLTFRSHSLEDLNGTISKKRFTYGTKRAYVSCEGENLISDDVLYSQGLADVLTREQGWEWFDPIRNEDRYKSLVERLNRAEEVLESSV